MVTRTRTRAHRLDVPGAVGGPNDIGGAVHGLVHTGELEAVIGRLEVQVSGRIAHADPVVEPPWPLFGHHQILRTPRVGEHSHGHRDLRTLGGSATEGVLARKVLA